MLPFLPGAAADAVLWAIPYQVMARNPAAESENQIHTDEVARRYGFRGGLVPGVTIYGYASHALLETLGPGWLAHGVTRARFIAPCYDGEELVVSVRQTGFEVFAGERTCVVGSASIPAAGRGAVVFPPIPAAPGLAAADRPVASEDVFHAGRVLAPVGMATDWAVLADYLEMIGEPSTLYAAEGLLHPGLLLQGANRILTANVVLPTWLHVESDVEHHRAVRVGEPLEVRGRIGQSFERKGHRFVVLDVAWMVAEETVAAAHHTAIWQLAGR
jgi:hypothetical protein